MSDRNIKAAIASTKNEDPASVRSAIENELNLRVASALDDKKITVAQSMFDTPESEEDDWDDENADYDWDDEDDDDDDDFEESIGNKVAGSFDGPDAATKRIKARLSNDMVAQGKKIKAERARRGQQ